MQRLNLWRASVFAVLAVCASLMVTAAPAAAAPAPIPLTSSQCPTDIVEGEIDGCVTELQLLLNEDDAAQLTVDGDFGSLTLTAVKSYQSRHGLTVDGIVGPQTKASMYATSPAPAAISLTSSACPVDITEGEVDGCVTELQTLLNSHGARLTVDGNFGPLTLAAVKSFQSSHGLAVDGIVGPHTKAALDGSSTGGAPAPISLTSSSCPNYITEGEIDGCVTELQQLLNAHGAALSIDGDFGALTLAAVESFQSSHGLSVDGIVGPMTKAALNGEGFGVPPPISITSSSCPTDMTEGEIDGCVTDLQMLLNNHGAGLSVDGDFGPLTLGAVESYQASHGLSVDGIVGPLTKASLTGSSSGGNPPPPSQALLTKIVNDAKAIENGSAEPGWGGGKIPYVWGGGHHPSPGPSTGTCAGDPGSLSCTDPDAVGLDCSGFSRWVYDLAYGRDVLGSGNTNNQVSEMTRVSSPVPGDLVFFGTDPTNTHHVGVYIGNGQMINAFETGTVIQTNNVSDGGQLVGYYQYGSGSGGLGESTNYDWAKWVLHDGNWPQSSNNITVITRWMTSEEPTSNWFNRDNPLNNGYGCGGGSGLGTCANLLQAAHYVAENLILGQADYGAITKDFAASASPSTTAQAIWNSPWASSHYCYGGCWFNGTAATVAAPAADW